MVKNLIFVKNKKSKKFLNPKNPQDPPNTFLNQTKLQNPSKPQFMNILQCGKKPNFLKKKMKNFFLTPYPSKKPQKTFPKPPRNLPKYLKTQL